MGTWNFTAVSQVRTWVFLLQQNMTGKENLLSGLWDGDYTTWGRNLPPDGGEQGCFSSAFQATNVSDQLPFKPMLWWHREVELLIYTLKWCRSSTEISVSLPSASLFSMLYGVSGLTAQFLYLSCKSWPDWGPLHVIVMPRHCCN